MPEALNIITLCGFLLSILFVSRSSTLTLLHLSGSRDTLFCNLIALTLGLALSFSLMTPTLAAVSSLLSDKPFLF